MSNPVSGKSLRVVQWATGTVGAFAMRAVLEHPDMELVGVRVFSPTKEGRDAGELCGLPPVGVKATCSRDDILALKPDCVIYMPDRTDLGDVCALLENGSNIVTTRSDFFHAGSMEEGARARVEAACRQGGTSIHATGSSPGFITEVLPIAFTSVVRRLDFLAIEEYANCLEGCSEEMLTDLMGFGDTPEQFAQRQHGEHRAFEYSFNALAQGLGLTIDSYQHAIDIALCRAPTKLRESTIDAGTVGAQRVSMVGLRNGEPLVRFRSNWFVTLDVECDWGLRPDGWRVDIEGDTPFSMTIDLPMPIEDSMRASARYTAHRPVNAVPCVVAAPPGILSTHQLPQVLSRLG